MRGLAQHLFGVKGRADRTAMWQLWVVRTVLGVGFVELYVSDAAWDDIYRTIIELALFWPTFVALPIRRLRDLGRTWRTWLAVWAVTLSLCVPAVVSGAVSAEWRVTFSIGSIPTDWTIAPDVLPAPSFILMAAAIVLQLVYLTVLYFVPGKQRDEQMPYRAVPA